MLNDLDINNIRDLDDDTVDLVLEWQPDILMAGGPPLYLEQLSLKLRNRAWQNAVRLVGSVDILILDHHLMRSLEGLQWLDSLLAARLFVRLISWEHRVAFLRLKEKRFMKKFRSLWDGTKIMQRGRLPL